MKFAYLINSHKNAIHVKRLVDQLNNADTVFVIHVSKTCEKGFWKEIRNLLDDYQNVYFCKREKSIHYGFAIVQATINGMKTLLKHNLKFDYFHLLSGQDYPIKSNKEIFNFFEKENGKQFFLLWKMFPKPGEDYFENHPWGKFRQEYRVTRHNLIINGKIVTVPEILSKRLISKPLWPTIKIFLYESPKYIREKKWKSELLILILSRLFRTKRNIENLSFELYGGKTWFSITKECLEHIVYQHDNIPKWKKFFKRSYIPDESYFHTIVMNSSFSKNVINDYLREVEWEGGDGTHPVIWTLNDFDRLAKSNNFWARKFEDSVDSKILDEIDEKLL